MKARKMILFVCGFIAIGLIALTAMISPSGRVAKADCTVDCWNVISSADYSSDSDNVLLSIAAVGLNDIWAVGYYNLGGEKTLAEHWNGTSWSIPLTTTNPGSDFNVFAGVTAPSSSNVWAVGYYEDDTSNAERTLVEKYNGSSWSLETSANQGSGNNELVAVDFVSSSQGWAVGHYLNGTVDRTLIEHTTNSGVTWSIVTSPNASTGDNILTGVSTIPSSGGEVFASGYYVGSGGHYLTLIEQWDGSQWNVITGIPDPGSADNLLFGIKAVSSTSAWAVGNDTNSSGPSETLAIGWDGSGWKSDPPDNFGTSHNYMKAVTGIDASHRIWAVGYYNGSGGAVNRLAEYYEAGWHSTSPKTASTLLNEFYGTTEISNGSSGGVETTWAVGFQKNSGLVFEKTLIERFVESSGTAP